MASFEHVEQINGVPIPFKIYIEKRKSVRVSFGRSSIILRMPRALSLAEREDHFQKALKWVNAHISKNPSAIENYLLKDYDAIESLRIYGDNISLSIKYEDRKTGKGSYSKTSNLISIVLPKEINGHQKNKMIQQLLSRTCAHIFKDPITQRVHQINDQCFHKNIKSVNLKYNKSNWGSCSSVSNINLSTRLLFAPMDIIDYVIIHELAHLYEMNHSAKFWEIVRQIMPSYKEKERWLKKNGHLCDF